MSMMRLFVKCAACGSRRPKGKEGKSNNLQAQLPPILMNNGFGLVGINKAKVSPIRPGTAS
jgi:hypothetical protein